MIKLITILNEIEIDSTPKLIKGNKYQVYDKYYCTWRPAQYTKNIIANGLEYACFDFINITSDTETSIGILKSSLKDRIKKYKLNEIEIDPYNIRIGSEFKHVDNNGRVYYGKIIYIIDNKEAQIMWKNSEGRVVDVSTKDIDLIKRWFRKKTVSRLNEIEIQSTFSSNEQLLRFAEKYKDELVPYLIKTYTQWGRDRYYPMKKLLQNFAYNKFTLEKFHFVGESARVVTIHDTQDNSILLSIEELPSAMDDDNFKKVNFKNRTFYIDFI